jgi:hypothetical protein
MVITCNNDDKNDGNTSSNMIVLVMMTTMIQSLHLFDTASGRKFTVSYHTNTWTDRWVALKMVITKKRYHTKLII